jgi:hypothetical protein
LFSDDFETQNLSKWNGVTTTSGETANVAPSNFNQGSYSARFTSNGGANNENGYSYKTISESEVYVRTYINIKNGLPLADSNDRFYITELMAGSQYLCGVGIRRSNGVDRWVLYARSGSSWVGPLYGGTSAVNEDQWYCVELHWKQSSTSGTVELYIDGIKVQQTTGINTANYGKATSVILGISSATGIQNNLEIYADTCRISRAYNGQ